MFVEVLKRGGCVFIFMVGGGVNEVKVEVMEGEGVKGFVVGGGERGGFGDWIEKV